MEQRRAEPRGEAEEALGYIETALDTADPWDDATWESLYSVMGILEDLGPEWAGEIAWSVRMFLKAGEPVSDLRAIGEALRLQMATL